LRSLVGNGNIPAKGASKEVIPIVGRKVHKQAVQIECGTAPAKQSVNPWVLFTFPDFMVLLTFTGIVYAINYSITATISSSFAIVYPYLSETALGLCYLSTGGGMIIGSTFTGKLLDWEYRRAKARAGSDGEFCIEHARLRTMPLHLGLFVALVLGWGWSLERQASIAIPLALQFLCKFDCGQKYSFVDR
jgi:predicted MFS family arabinose efflux permease